MLPIRRDLRFDLPPERINNWHAAGPHISVFMNTLSLFFPVGERFFIHSVRHYRERIKDPELQKAVAAFIGQEAMHGREHEEYNAHMFQAVPQTVGMERMVARLLGFVQKYTPASFQLSATIALEHFTAIMADGLLRDPAILEGAESHYAAIWNWHALEETEHKAVAYDVWRAVMGRNPVSYVIRVGGLIVASVILWGIAISFHLRTIALLGELGNRSGWRQFFRYGFTRPGFLRKLVLPWLSYFRPGFHPWDHDNSEFLERIRPLEYRYAKTEREAQPA
ncbi:MAG: metal-dependent hydrolase [Nevskia sp.]|nr:metal-dependent hydrolase [Nevskia sp.]